MYNHLVSSRIGTAFLAIVLCFISGLAVAAPRVIAKVPYTVTKPGQYVLSRSFAYAGITNAITIACDDVSLDLRGFTLTSTGDSVANFTAGIFAQDRRNITIRNGIVQGFTRAIYLEGSDAFGGHVVEEVRADASKFLGIQVKGRGSIVRNNRVSLVDGGTAAIRYGIHITGSGVRVANNTVFDVRAVAQTINNPVYGIFVTSSQAAVIEGNRVQNSALPVPFAGSGILVENSPGTFVINNTVSYFNGGISFVSSTSAVYRDNAVTANIGTYTGGIDGGGNSP